MAETGIDAQMSLCTSLLSSHAAEAIEAMGPFSHELQSLNLIDNPLEAILSIPIYEAVRTSTPAGDFCLGRRWVH